MKSRNYEKKKGIYFFSILFLLLEGIIFLLLTKLKLEEYQKITGIVEKEQYITVVVTKEERKLFYDNQKLFIKDQKTSYKIEEDYGKIMTKEKKEYYELLIYLPEKRKEKAKDIVEIIIHKRKKKIIEILKIIWEGD